MYKGLRKSPKTKYIVIAIVLSLVIGAFAVVKNDSNAEETVGVKYRAHVAYKGWLEWKNDGATAGTIGESRRLEALKIKLTGNMTGDVVYQTYVKELGWQDFVKNSETSGTEGQSKAIEAIMIRLEGKVSEEYDIQYRAHMACKGWTEWVANGAKAGSEYEGLRMEAIEIKMVKKSVSGETGVSFDEVIEENVQNLGTENNTQEEQSTPTEEPQQEQTQPEVEQPQPEVEQPQQEQNMSQESPFHKYTDLTDAQLRGIARLCQQEQGTARGAAAEASLMANHMDLRHCRAKNYEINGTGLYNYVRNGGWFAKAATHMDKKDLRDDVYQAVKKVLVEGKRTLPGYVNEHDCFSDISSATNDGSAISKKDRSAYVQHKTYVKNAYGGNYTFYCFPSDTSDPFGYTSKSKREEIGDFCYNFDDI